MHPDHTDIEQETLVSPIATSANAQAHTPITSLTEIALPTANSSPRFITQGPDGRLWFTELLGNKIGRISTDGTITELRPCP